MTTTIHNPKLAAGFLAGAVVAGLCLGTLGSLLVPERLMPEDPWLVHLITSACIWVAAYFLPETKTRQFASRQSALGGSALFMFLALGGLINLFAAAAPQSAFSKDGPFGYAFVLAFVFYWVSVWSIRGLKCEGCNPQSSDNQIH